VAFERSNQRRYCLKPEGGGGGGKPFIAKTGNTRS
jgi:hypothetical protein